MQIHKVYTVHVRREKEREKVSAWGQRTSLGVLFFHHGSRAHTQMVRLPQLMPLSTGPSCYHSYIPLPKPKDNLGKLNSLKSKHKDWQQLLHYWDLSVSYQPCVCNNFSHSCFYLTSQQRNHSIVSNDSAGKGHNLASMLSYDVYNITFIFNTKTQNKETLLAK